jgi:hypothetical protein
MPGPSATIHLPYASRILVRTFVNAARPQRFTITPTGSHPIVFTGTGDGDTPAGATVIYTPASGPSPLGASVSIAIDHSVDEGRSWQASQVDSGGCQIVLNNLIVVASEDAGADSWCAATVYFCWTKVAPDAAHATLIKSMAGPRYHGRA